VYIDEELRRSGCIKSENGSCPRRIS